MTLYTVPASIATRADFDMMKALFGKADQKKAELAEAQRQREDAVQAAYKLTKLADVIEAKNAAIAAHEARVAEIELRHRVEAELRFTIELQKPRRGGMKYTDAIRAHDRDPRDETERALAILDVLDLMLGKPESSVRPAPTTAEERRNG
jgi:hypothetical protein